MTSGPPCGGGERRRRASRCLRTGRHKASGFLRTAWTAEVASARLQREGALLQLGPAGMQMLNWNDLRYVLAVSRGGTLRAAARLLGVDDTTVARRLVAMQDTIGARLYQRLVDGTLQLTTSGERAALHAEKMEREVGALAVALARGRRGFWYRAHYLCSHRRQSYPGACGGNLAQASPETRVGIRRGRERPQPDAP